jgi:molybdate transport system substrate-binding protein
MATRHVLAALNEAAAGAGHPKMQIESVGGVDAATRVAAGEQFDLVFLAHDALERLAAAGHVDADTVTPLMLSQVAAAVGTHAEKPAARPEGEAFDDAAGMREALLAAHRIGYSTGPSGVALVEMIHAWGLTDELGSRLVQARPGVPVARSLADADVDLGFQQLSELVGQPGVRILGVLPADCAIDTVFAGAVATTAGDTAAARALELLRFLASGSVAPIVEAHNFARVS